MHAHSSRTQRPLRHASGSRRAYNGAAGTSLDISRRAAWLVPRCAVQAGWLQQPVPLPINMCREDHPDFAHGAISRYPLAPPHPHAAFPHAGGGLSCWAPALLPLLPVGLHGSAVHRCGRSRRGFCSPPLRSGPPRPWHLQRAGRQPSAAAGCRPRRRGAPPAAAADSAAVYLGACAPLMSPRTFAWCMSEAAFRRPVRKPLGGCP